MNEHYHKISHHIMDTIHYGVIATVSPDGRPWNSPVVVLPDADMNIYWFSDTDARHSRNLQANHQVCIVLFDSTVPMFSAQIDHGLYIQAEAEEVTDPDEIEYAYGLLDRPAKHRPLTQAVYRAIPEYIWINDVERTPEGRFVRDTRHQLDLAALRARRQ